MSNHTPGPWYAEKKSCHSGHVAICHWDGEEWWEVWSPEWVKGGGAEANARLIAAAPEMLEALKTVSVWADNPMDYDEDYRDIQEMVMSVIRKADNG